VHRTSELTTIGINGSRWCRACLLRVLFNTFSYFRTVLGHLFRQPACRRNSQRLNEKTAGSP
jgi:hypothetical protein